MTLNYTGRLYDHDDGEGERRRDAASERGFSLAPGLRDDARLEAHVAEAARCADPTRRNAHLARALLERAIDAQTERVFSLGTVGKDTLTVLTAIDFVGSDAEGEPGDEDSSTKSSKARHDETEKALAELEAEVRKVATEDKSEVELAAQSACESN